MSTKDTEKHNSAVVILSWLMVMTAPVTAMMKMSPHTMQIATVFTVLGIFLNWFERQRPD